MDLVYVAYDGLSHTNIDSMWNTICVGPSGVCALPFGVAAERSVHYFWDSVLLIAS